MSFNPDTKTIEASISSVRAADVEAIAEVSVPYYADDSKKTKYLSFRASGFNSKESQELVGVTERTVFRWRADDEHFQEIDTTGIGNFRKKFAIDFLTAEYTRNFRMMMQVDWVITQKYLKWGDDELTPFEQAYMKTIRSMYSPTQLGAMISTAAGHVPAEGRGGDIFTQVVLAVNTREPSAIEEYDAQAISKYREIQGSEAQSRPESTSS